MNPIECTTTEEAELIEKIAEAFGENWWVQESFEQWSWLEDAEAPGHRPMLAVDDCVFSTFEDGVLGCNSPGPGGDAYMLRAFRGHADNGDMIWETRIFGDPRH